ncbi:GSCOCG00012136001-RA-CDS, partial [Cotesia congregata]
MRDMPATIGNISKKILKSITATSAPRVDIIFDQYFSPSIKDYERTLRCEMNDLDFKITGPMQVRPVDFNKELKNIKFKQAFVTFLIDHWATQEMAPLIGETIINLNNPDEPFEKRFKNYDASNLPPCKAELKQQLLRTQYITSIWRNAHLRFPSTLAPTRNGWDLQNGKLEFYWFEGDCMPPSVMDALK